MKHIAKLKLNYDERRRIVKSEIRLGKSIKEVAFDNELSTSTVCAILRTEGYATMYVTDAERRKLIALRKEEDSR